MEGVATITTTYSVSQKNPPLRFSDIFPNGWTHTVYLSLNVRGDTSHEWTKLE